MAHDHDRISVIDGKLANVSATIIQGFRRCPRFWFYAEVERRPKKKTGKKGADLGTECHDRMERWLKTGHDVRGPIERHGHEMIEPFLRWAPFNGGPMLVEEKFKSLRTPGGVVVNGSFDALLPPGTARPTYATLIDHKFKKDLEKWATPREKLLIDEQFIVYGFYALSIYPTAEGVYFRHHNHQTNSRRNKPVDCEDTRASIFAKFAELGKLIDGEMAPCVGKAATEVPARPGGACYAFGGCDFEQVCPDSPRNRASANIFGLTADSLTVKNGLAVEEPAQEEDMRYLGGKSRLAKRIVDKIQELVPGVSEVWEPFCGGAAVTCELASRGIKVYASDLFPGLAKMHAAACGGFRLPPHGCTDEERKAAKGKADPHSVALRFGLGFGGNYSSGLARPPDLYARQFNSHCDKLQQVGASISWAERGYESISPKPGDVVYCDPPYAGTTGYATGAFDHVKFWETVRSWAAAGAHVFVSEFSGPSNVPVVWRHERSVGIDGGAEAGYSKKTELLFYLRPTNLTVKNGLAVEEPSQEKTNMGLMDQMMKAGTAPVVIQSVSQKVEGDTLKIQVNAAAQTPIETIPVNLTITPAESVQAAKEEKAIEQAEAEVSKETSLPSAEKRASKSRAKKSDEPAGLTLLVDCFSSRAQDITPWALDLAKQLAQRHGVQDIRVAPKESDLSYGGWRACIAAEALKVPPTGVAYLAGSELTEPVIEALTSVASMVVRGRR